MRLIIAVLGFAIATASPVSWSVKVREIYLPTGAISSGTQGLSFSRYDRALYVSHTVVFENKREWQIRKSTNLGNSWTTLHSIPVTATVWSAGGRGLAFTHKGSIFAIGRDEDVEKRSHWIVVRKNSAGWKVVDDFTFYPAPGDHYAYHIAVAPVGHVCVTGKVANNTDWEKVTERRWIVRCSADDGETWKTIDNEVGSESSSIAFNSRGDLFVSGTKFLDKEGVLIVKKLSKGTLKWVEVDRFKYAGRFTGAISAFIDSKDRIFVAGSAWENTETQLRRWILRKSIDGGKTWVTADRYALEESTYSEAYQVTEDSRGRLYTVGYAMDSGKRYHAIVRSSDDGGKSWITASDFMGPKDLGVYGHNITAVYNHVLLSGGWYAKEGRRSIIAELVPNP